jgi:hypothetical protein
MPKNRETTDPNSRFSKEKEGRKGGKNPTW